MTNGVASGSILSLSGLGDLHNVQCQIQEIEAFARNLRNKGGFFFFREHYPGKQNKIYNGTHVSWCPDRMEEALPMLSAERMHFSEDFREDGGRRWMKISHRRLLDIRSGKTKETTGYLEDEGQTPEPRITYHYRGKPGIRFRRSHSIFATYYLNEPDVPDERICQDFVDPHLKGPWQRLWSAKNFSCLSPSTY